jgi:hypothetical protein
MTEHQAGEQPTVVVPAGVGSSAGTVAPEQPEIPNPYGIPAAPYQAFQPPTAPKRSKFKRFRLLIAVGVVAVVAIGGKVIADHNKAGRDASGNISKKGNLDAFSIKEGDCFQDPGAGTDFSSVTAVPCTSPHTAQVYASFAYPDAPTTIPDDTTLQSTADTQCGDLQTKLDQNVATTNNLSGSFLVPNDVAWKAGNTTILCVVTADTAFSGTAISG